MTIRHTLRFNVFLDPNNTENYETSLLDLIKEDKHQLPNGHNKEEIDHIDKLVKEMEAKYGPVAVVKGRRIRVNDFVDQGNGYDADDPFIDDSGEDEALAVAPDLMTEHGGFFINSERLKLNESNFVIERVEGGNESMNISKQKFHPTNITKKSKSQKLLSQARKRLTTSAKGCTIKRIVTSADKKLEDIFNDVVSTNKSIEVAKVEAPVKTGKKVEQVVESLGSNGGQDKEATQGHSFNNLQNPKLELPSGLTDALMEKIRAVIEISDKCKLEGSKMSAHFNSALFELDTMLTGDQKGAKSIRTLVLRFVSQQVDIKYDSILRRICKAKDSRKKQNMRPLFNSLEDAIKEAMIDSVARYEGAMGLYAGKVEALRLSQAVDANPEQNAEASRNKLKPPKRIFTWTLTCKTLLFKLASNELEVLRASSSKTAPEEHLNKFYHTNVISLFQPRWMTVCQLMKVSTALVNDFKQCILSGKEFKAVVPAVKSKTEPKCEPSQPPAASSCSSSVAPPALLAAPLLKEAVLSITKCTAPSAPAERINGTVTAATSKGKSLSPPIKKPIVQLKSLHQQQHAPDTVVNTITIKPPVHASAPHAPAPYTKPPRNSSTNNSKPTVRTSSILPQRSLSAATKSVEAVKRYIDGSPVFTIQSQHSSADQSLSYLHNYLYARNDDNHPLADHIRASSLSNNNIVGTGSLDSSPYCSKQQSQQHMHQRLMINEFTHSSPYTLHADGISRLHSHRPQPIPDLSTIFSPQPQPDSRHAVGTMGHHPHNAAVSPNKQRRLDPSVQQHYHHGMVPPEFPSPPKTGAYRPSPTMIDLTRTASSSSSTQSQTSPSTPSLFGVNMNAAHCTNARNFHN